MGKNWGCKKKPGTKHKGQAKDRDRNARKRAAAARKAPAEPLTSPPPAKKQKAKATPVTEPTYEPSKSLHESYRRITIIYHYEELGCPAESEWSKHGGTLRQIANELKMPDACDYAPIRAVLKRHLNGEDVWYRKPGGGRKTKLTPGEQSIMADCLRRGTGQVQAAYIGTAWREQKGMSKEEAKVSRKAVRTAVTQKEGERNRRGTTSTGSRDPTSKWATSRDAQAQQFMAEIETPEETAAASLPGPTMTVAHGNRSRRVQTLAKDPLSLLGKDIIIKPLGSTWPNQPAAVRRKRWPCTLSGYIDEYKYENGDEEAAYIISCEGHNYPMRVDDVVQLLPPAVRPADGGASVFGRFPLESISWWDEKHKQISMQGGCLGHSERAQIGR